MNSRRARSLARDEFKWRIFDSRTGIFEFASSVSNGVKSALTHLVLFPRFVRGNMRNSDGSLRRSGINRGGGGGGGEFFFLSSARRNSSRSKSIASEALKQRYGFPLTAHVHAMWISYVSFA